MHLVIVTIGSRGDVQPLVPIARRLIAAGYRVTIATDPDHEEFVTSRGVAFRAYGPPMRPFTTTDTGRAWLESNGNIFEHCRLVRKVLGDYAHALSRSAERALDDADAILFTAGEATSTFVAEKRGIPAIALPLFPVVTTGAFGPLGMRALPLFSQLSNRLGWAAVHNLFSWTFRDAMDRSRERLGLPRLRRSIHSYWRRREIPFLHLISPAVVPRPHDWPKAAELTGYSFLDEGASWQPSKELVDFIGSGAPPIAVGFGSMQSSRPAELRRIVADTLERTNKRAVVLGGGSHEELGIASSKNLHVVEQVPHDWLFPKMSAVVHHGGAGTTAASLRAGKPTVVCAFFSDQPFWGRRVAELEVGPEPLARKTLTVKGLGMAIERACSDLHLQRNAVALGKRLRSEDGVGVTVSAIERHLRRCVATG